MAASGINEHNEACRKQSYINRQTYRKHQTEERIFGKDCGDPELIEENLSRKRGAYPGHLGPLSSYDLEQMSKKHGSAGTDKERRDAVHKNQYTTYSAKIGGRLNSINYEQQW